MSFGTFTAGETISPGTPLAVTTAGVVYPCCPTNPNTRNLVGIAIESGFAGGAVRVAFDVMPNNIFTDLVPGEQYYTGLASGTILSGSHNFNIELQDSGFPDAYLHLLGTAVNATRLNLERANPRILMSGSSTT